MEQATNIPPHAAPLYNRFLQIGRSGKNNWWRYVLGIVIVSAFYIVGEIPLAKMAVSSALKHGHTLAEILDNQEKIIDPAFTGLNSNVELILELLIFFFAMAGLWIVVRFLHSKKFTSIITSASRIRWKRFAFAFLIWMIFGFAGQYISMLVYPGNYKVCFHLQPFLLTLLIGVLMLPVQTWFEEYFFRGYLLQSIGTITKSAIIPVFITGFLFMLVHMTNPEVKAYGALTMFPAYLLPGIFFALFATLDEGLESTMGIHFANNLFGTIGVTSSASAIQANTIWTAEKMYPVSDNIFLFAQLLLLFFILMKVNKWELKKLYRKYQ
ncbi:MAG: CPBP family intramembrane metalloprotease [Bacteroidetes bacterium]|nr:CPBP family intramembrane metalloprotease [Bacteroidota bacterium]